MNMFIKGIVTFFVFFWYIELCFKLFDFELYFNSMIDTNITVLHKVWQEIYEQSLDLNHWYTIDSSWSRTTGIQLRLDGKVLKDVLDVTHWANAVTEKHSLHLAKYEFIVYRIWR